MKYLLALALIVSVACSPVESTKEVIPSSKSCLLDESKDAFSESYDVLDQNIQDFKPYYSLAPRACTETNPKMR